MQRIQYSLFVFTVAIVTTVVATPSFGAQAPPAEGSESDLIAVLGSDAEIFDKAKACQQLAVIGTKECVPALAKLLTDEKLSHYARFGLEPISDPSVDVALRGAMTKVRGGLLVGVIDSIGVRRDAKAVDALIKRLGDSDPAIASAASAALGRIATPDAVAATTKGLSGDASMRAAYGDACLAAADMLVAEDKKAEAIAVYDAVLKADMPRFITIAALYGAIRARGADGLAMMLEQLRSQKDDQFAVGLRMAQELSGDAVTKALIDEFAKLPVERKTLMIHVLGNRGDKAALSIVVEAARGSDAGPRIAAIRVLGSLGDASAVSILCDATAGDGDLAAAAADSLANLPGKDVDTAIVALLQKGEGGQRVVMIDLVGRRGIASAVPALLKLADDDDPEISAAAIESLGVTIGPDQLSVLVDRLVKPRSPEIADAARGALKKAVLRMPDRDACAKVLRERMSGAPAAVKSDLMSLLGTVGGREALDAISAATRSGDEASLDAATRVLGVWMSPDCAPVLLELAKTLDNRKYKIRALRGYLRVPRQLDVPIAERVAMCRKAIDVATRDQEKQLAIEVLARYPSPDSLAAVALYLDHPTLKESACVAAVTISEGIIRTHPASVASAMKKATAAKDRNVAARAQQLLNQANKKLR